MAELIRSQFPLPHLTRLRQLAPRTSVYTAHELSYVDTSSIRGWPAPAHTALLIQQLLAEHNSILRV